MVKTAASSSPGTLTSPLVATDITTGITTEMGSLLKKVEGVVSLHFLFRDGIFSTWVGTTKYKDENVRRAIYGIEDKIEKDFSDVKFDFNLIAVPPGRTIDDFISDATPVFKRTA